MPAHSSVSSLAPIFRGKVGASRTQQAAAEILSSDAAKAIEAAAVAAGMTPAAAQAAAAAAARAQALSAIAPGQKKCGKSVIF